MLTVPDVVSFTRNLLELCYAVQFEAPGTRGLLSALAALVPLR